MLKLLMLPVLSAALTIWSPRSVLPFWLLAFWSGTLWFWNQIDFADDPAFISASVVFLPLWLFNGPATVCRIAFIIVDWNAIATRGYR